MKNNRRHQPVARQGDGKYDSICNLYLGTEDFASATLNIDNSGT